LCYSFARTNLLFKTRLIETKKSSLFHLIRQEHKQKVVEDLATSSF